MQIFGNQNNIKQMTGIELEQLEDQAQIILENEILPENFMRYTDFLDALGGDHERASIEWMKMIDSRDKFPLI
jgi:hypothetical protein